MYQVSKHNNKYCLLVTCTSSFLSTYCIGQAASFFFAPFVRLLMTSKGNGWKSEQLAYIFTRYSNVYKDCRQIFFLSLPYSTRQAKQSLIFHVSFNTFALFQFFISIFNKLIYFKRNLISKELTFLISKKPTILQKSFPVRIIDRPQVIRHFVKIYENNRFQYLDLLKQIS